LCLWPAQDPPERSCPESRTSRDAGWRRPHTQLEPDGAPVFAFRAELPESLLLPLPCRFRRRENPFAVAALFPLACSWRALSAVRILRVSRQRDSWSITVCRNSQRRGCDGPHVLVGMSCMHILPGGRSQLSRILPVSAISIVVRRLLWTAVGCITHTVGCGSDSIHEVCVLLLSGEGAILVCF